MKYRVEHQERTTLVCHVEAMNPAEALAKAKGDHPDCVQALTVEHEPIWDEKNIIPVRETGRVNKTADRLPTHTGALWEAVEGQTLDEILERMRNEGWKQDAPTSVVLESGEVTKITLRRNRKKFIFYVKNNKIGMIEGQPASSESLRAINDTPTVVVLEAVKDK